MLKAIIGETLIGFVLSYSLQALKLPTFSMHYAGKEIEKATFFNIDFHWGGDYVPKRHMYVENKKGYLYSLRGTPLSWKIAV